MSNNETKRYKENPCNDYRDYVFYEKLQYCHDSYFFLIKKTGDLHRWPVLKKQCKFMKTNLSKQVTIYFLERLNFFFLFDRCSTEEKV